MSKKKDDYRACFIEAFNLDDKYNVEILEYQAISEWDSVGHMSLVSIIEDKFDVLLDTEDIINLSSYCKGIQILIKYGVEF